MWYEGLFQNLEFFQPWGPGEFLEDFREQKEKDMFRIEILTLNKLIYFHNSKFSPYWSCDFSADSGLTLGHVAIFTLFIFWSMLKNPGIAIEKIRNATTAAIKVTIR